MSEQTMIERVASAAEKAALAHWDNETELYPAIALAAVEAMREPTDMMGTKLGGDYSPGSWSATRIWQAMIDAALSDHATTEGE